MQDKKFTDANGKILNVSLIGFFRIPEFEKEYIMYGLVDEEPNNENGHVLFGEVVRTEDTVQILGILKEEKEVVVAYYNEIANQLGGE